MKAYAINRVHRRDKDGNRVVVKAKTVFEVPTAEFNDLVKLGAAREATAGEIAEDKVRQDRENGTDVAARAAGERSASDGFLDGVRKAGDETGNHPDPLVAAQKEAERVAAQKEADRKAEAERVAATAKSGRKDRDIGV